MVDHIDYITSQQMKALDTAAQEGGLSLYHRIDNAGQNVWNTNSPPAAKEKFAQLMKCADEDIEPETVRQAADLFYSYHGNVFGGKKPLNQSYPKAQTHEYLSLLYHVQPESDVLASRKGIQEALTALGLGKPIAEEELAERILPLISSISSPSAYRE